MDITETKVITMRGMIKWKPFNTLLKESDIIEIEQKKQLINKPTLMTDRINYINETLIEALKNNLNTNIEYFSHGMLKTTNGKIDKLNTLEKYILINKTRIYFKNLINIKIL